MTHTSQERDALLDAALAYAEAGWPVFPLRPGTKRPATPNHTEATCDGSDHRCTERHTGWEQRATLDPHRITTAWRHRPYGIAIATGPAQLLVIDLDPAKGDQPSGAETLIQLEEQTGQTLPPTWTVATPSGGRHLYYRQPAAQTLGNTAGRIGPGVDTRGNGGYVVAPPTATKDGDYWIVDEHPPVGLPKWFAERLRSEFRPHAPIPVAGRRSEFAPVASAQTQRYVQRAVIGEVERITTAIQGRRNHALFLASIAIGQLVAAGLLDGQEAEQLLLDGAGSHIAAGAYTRHQAQQTIGSGLRRGLREPRQLPANLTVGAT